MKIILEVGGGEVIASGRSKTSAKYKKDDFGVGLICTTDLEPAKNNI